MKKQKIHKPGFLANNLMSAKRRSQSLPVILQKNNLQKNKDKLEQIERPDDKKNPPKMNNFDERVNNHIKYQLCHSKSHLLCPDHENEKNISCTNQVDLFHQFLINNCYKQGTLCSYCEQIEQERQERLGKNLLQSQNSHKQKLTNQIYLQQSFYNNKKDHQRSITNSIYLVEEIFQHKQQNDQLQELVTNKANLENFQKNRPQAIMKDSEIQVCIKPKYNLGKKIIKCFSKLKKITPQDKIKIKLRQRQQQQQQQKQQQQQYQFEFEQELEQELELEQKPEKIQQNQVDDSGKQINDESIDQ